MRLADRAAWLSSALFFGVLPAAIVVVVALDPLLSGFGAPDLHVYREAAKAVLSGETLYPPVDDASLAAGTEYVYTPVVALASVPTAWLPPDLAGFLVSVLLVCAVVGALLLLGVRDWRCYGLAFLWPPVISGLQTANVTLVLVLATALAWRYRSRVVPAGVVVGGAVAVKTLMWPLAVWLLATRRTMAAAVGVVTSCVLVLGSWAVVGFEGLSAYPERVRRLAEVMDGRSYSIYRVVSDLGMSPGVSRAAWLVVAGAFLGAVALLGSRGRDESSFVLAVAAVLVCSPLGWLHYLSLLVVVVAVAQPVLGAAWLAPLAMWITARSDEPSLAQASATLAIAAITIGLALHELSKRPVRIPGAPRPRAGGAPA